jgi:hypothetical protein
MVNFTKKELEEINSVKKKLYDNLSYTDLSYETILKRIISLFRNGRLNTSWDNISESDIMFIFMSLLSAHKDMLNYMIDYRILETYLNTARESASLYRIASSFGFNIPSYRSASFIATLDEYEENVELQNFSTFRDSNGVPWTYIDQDYDNSGDNDPTKIIIDSASKEVTLFQGIAYTIGNLLPSNFDKKSKTHIISNRSIAIGSTRDEKGCSLLYATNGSDSVEFFTQVSDIYSYTGTEDYVYSLSVDPLGTTYIKLPMNFDMSLLDERTLVFKYLITSGNSILNAGEIELGNSILVPKVNSFYRGENPVDKDTFKELFKSYYASAETLVTLYDYKNYTLNIQKTLQSIDKCLVIDNQHDTRGEDLAADGVLENLEIAIYALDEDNEDINVWETEEIEVSAFPPALGDVGDYYYDTADGNLYIATAGGWVVDETDISTVIPRPLSGGDRYVDVDNELLYTCETSNEAILKALLDENSVSGVSILINTDGTNPLEATTIYVSTGGSISTDIKEVIIDYIKSKDIGSTITSSEIVKELSLNGYTDFSDRDITLSLSSDFSSDLSSISLEYYQYATIENENINPS